MNNGSKIRDPSLPPSLRCGATGKIRNWTAFAFRCFPKPIDVPAGLQHCPLDACQTSQRLADVLRKSGVRVLGDLDGWKVGDFGWERNCGFKTLHELDSLVSALARARPDVRRPFWTENACSAGNESLPRPWSTTAATAAGFAIRRLLDRAISGDFDEAEIRHVSDATAVVELLTLLEQGIAKLSPRERQFLLARIHGLTFEEIGRRRGLTRARAHQVVAKAVEALKKTYGPRIPRLLEIVKQRCTSSRNGSPLTAALLERWIGDSAKSFGLSSKAQVRLIAALDRTIPCYVQRSSRRRADTLDLAGLARALRLASRPENLPISGTSVREPPFLINDRYPHRYDRNRNNILPRRSVVGDF